MILIVLQTTFKPIKIIRKYFKINYTYIYIIYKKYLKLNLVLLLFTAFS